LLANGVTVGFGSVPDFLRQPDSPIDGFSNSVLEKWEARNARFDIAWAALEANGTISKSEAFALASTNLERLLGVNVHSNLIPDHVATAGGDLMSMNSKVVAIISPRNDAVDLF
jgi:hypothetical protein